MSQETYTFEELASIKNFSYNIENYPFVKILRKIFNGWSDRIEKLHLFFEDSDKLEQITIDQDTKTRFHRQYYDSPHYPELLETYYRFVKDMVLPLFKTDDVEFVVQKDPCFRIHLPNNTALGKRITENDPDDMIGIHCDGDYGHPPGEMNFMLTFGYQRESNSCYVETSMGSGQFQPFEMNYGQFISFYGNKLRHYNKTNITGDSRVSIDFRVIPLSKYDDTNQESSLHGKRPFRLGGYYVLLKKD